ncbi:hypothetical protein [uncultured Desulfobacter sp.]|uniref:hypothetical protein n=1 Tax=uncultured Desulfobacter sp. TaxID=240139 RepID=UPI0029F4E3FA|nr:hypothetical protein [uncultured Desulfobacter sp.]
MKHHALSQIPPIEVSALSKITPQEAQTLVEFMLVYMPQPKRLKPTMTWEESDQIDMLFDKIRAVLSCRAEKEVAK